MRWKVARHLVLNHRRCHCHCHCRRRCRRHRRRRQSQFDVAAIQPGQVSSPRSIRHSIHLQFDGRILIDTESQVSLSVCSLAALKNRQTDINCATCGWILCAQPSSYGLLMISSCMFCHRELLSFATIVCTYTYTQTHTY